MSKALPTQAAACRYKWTTVSHRDSFDKKIPTGTLSHLVVLS